jgi:polyisoprenoid-binding protein YceI
MATDTKWVIDRAHSAVAFKIQHLMISYVKGIFREFDASIHTTGNDFLSAAVDFWIDPASLVTMDDKRDSHLASVVFFDMEHHKEITFRLNTIEKAEGEDNYLVWGDLAIKGITKRIQLDVTFGGITTDPRGQERAGFAITGSLNRKDWELNWNVMLEAGGLLLSDEVIVDCELELTKA